MNFFKCLETLESCWGRKLLIIDFFPFEWEIGGSGAELKQPILATPMRVSCFCPNLIIHELPEGLNWNWEITNALLNNNKNYKMYLKAYFKT